MIMCPYDGKLFHQVPGYTLGMNHCPLCKGIITHVAYEVPDALQPKNDSIHLVRDTHDDEVKSVIPLLTIETTVDVDEEASVPDATGIPDA